MKRFTSKDLMVSVLPSREESAEPCSNECKKHTDKENTRPGTGKDDQVIGDSDLSVLQDDLEKRLVEV